MWRIGLRGLIREIVLGAVVDYAWWSMETVEIMYEVETTCMKKVDEET